MAAARSQQQDLVVQAGLVSSLTSLFSQKLNSTEELRKVPVVKPTPLRPPQPHRPPSNLTYPQVGKPAHIQLVQDPTSPLTQHQQQRQQQPRQQSYVTRKTKYTSRSAADEAIASSAFKATAGPHSSDKYRLEEWTVYETLPADMAASSETARTEEHLRRQEAEQRRLKAEVEEKKHARVRQQQQNQQRKQQQREVVSRAEFAATPELFTTEEWTVYETVPSESVNQVSRSASSGQEHAAWRRQQQDMQTNEHQHRQALTRSESTDSLLGYRRYLLNSEETRPADRPTTKTVTTKARSSSTGVSRQYKQQQQNKGSPLASRSPMTVRHNRQAVRTPEVYSTEQWTVYETIPAVAEVQETRNYHQQQLQERPSKRKQSTRRSVRWTPDEPNTTHRRQASNRTPDVYSREEWTVYETIPAEETPVYNYGSQQQQIWQQSTTTQGLRRSPSQESVIGYQRYLEDSYSRQPVTSVATASSSRVQQQSSETRNASSKNTVRRSQNTGHDRASTPVRTEEWTVVRQVPADAEELSGVGHRPGRLKVHRTNGREADSPHGYRRYLGESNASLATDSRRLDDGDETGSENPFHTDYYINRDNPIYSGF